MQIEKAMHKLLLILNLGYPIIAGQFFFLAFTLSQISSPELLSLIKKKTIKKPTNLSLPQNFFILATTGFLMFPDLHGLLY